MKILIFCGAYLPAQKYGGPVTAISNLVSRMGDDITFEIVCRDHDLGDRPPFPGIQEGFQQVGKAQVCYLPDRQLRGRLFERIIRERKPDCLYLWSVFEARLNVPVLRIARRLRIPVVYAPCGEMSAAALAMKTLKKRIFLTALRLSGLYRRVYFQATGEAEYADILRELPTAPERVFLVPNMPGLPPESTGTPKRAGRLRVVWISRIHRVKNLMYAVERILELHGDVLFDIYGPVEQPDYCAECEKRMAHTPERFRYCGQVPVGQSAAVFAQYDCFLFPTHSENYSHAIAESLLAGTPVVISRGTTPWDDSGRAISLENPALFTETLQLLCDMDEAAYMHEREAVQAYAAQKMNIAELRAQTRRMFESTIKNKSA